MILYRYETWKGGVIFKDQILKPTKLVNDDYWPALVFLTKNPKWNESVIADTLIKSKPIRARSPKVFTKRGIPCWRFSVEISEPLYKLMYPHPYWLVMFREAKEKGINISEWHWTTHEYPIVETHVWNGWWKPTDT